ncbi:tandem-95 repeat protein [Sphingosinicella sp. BN140058]|uniref:tandem-95 repeat protein n=1 Tax=Sphingosinicella sp. BN140058 TaxID=1892855 RepID=UPI0013E9E821|nr:tandem-95 repeat protein [Sphingosinicella sp. BN140058]
MTTTTDTIRLSRRGATSSNNDGTLSGSGGSFTYSGPAQPGDSGSAVLMHFDSKRFILGSIMTITDTAGSGFSGPAHGLLFTPQNFSDLMRHLEGSQSGDVTQQEPTNLIVGSDAGQTASGSYRPDIVLGRGGDDTINDGDAIGDAVFANDQLFGGAGKDSFTLGAGSDLVHGGDHRIYPGATARLTIEDDGEDSVSYSAETHAIKVKIVVTSQGDQTYRTTTDFAKSVFVETTRDSKTDTLISIEKITATEKTDVVEIKSLTADPLAGNDNKGGLAEIDLAAHPDGAGKGDLVDMKEMTAAVKGDLASGRFELKSDSSIGLKIVNAERIEGGKGADELSGNDQKNEIKGNDGDDVLKGAQGEDKLEGGAGIDTITGGADADELIGGAGDDILDGADGDTAGDKLDGGADNDTFKTNNGDSIVDLDQGDIVMLGGKTLAGGEREKPPADPCAPTPPNQEDDESGTYESSDGTIYVYNKAAGTLTVTSNGESITINGFSNGEAGIRLKETRPDQQQAECQRDPLIIDLNGDRELVEELYDSRAYFDLDNDGFAEHVAWALPEDGLLALDRNGDGRISSGAELFGTGRTTSHGNRPEQDGTDGFTELSKLDTNRDKVIDSSDAQYGELRIWQDADGDAVTDAGELKSLAELGIVSISLKTQASNDIDCGCDGTEVVSMSTVARADGSTLGIYDAFLSIDQYDTREVGPAAVSAAASALPQLLGSGQLSDLRVAMSCDPALLEMVQSLSQLTPDHAGELFGRVEQILLRWTGADAVAIDSRGPNINARWLSAIETITGSPFEQAIIGHNPRQDAASMLGREWQEWVVETAAKLLGQIDLGSALTPGLSFAAAAFFVADEGTSLDQLMEAVAAGASAQTAQAASYWHVMLEIVSRYAPELGVTRAAIDSAAKVYIDAAGVPFDVAALRAAFVGGASSGAISGTHSGFGLDGHDLIVALPGVTRLNGGSGDDAYLLGSVPANVRITDASGDDALYLDVLPEDVSLIFTAAGGTLRVSVVSDAGTYANFDLSLAGGGISAAIEHLVFADGRVRNVVDGNTIVTADGGMIVFGRRDAGSILAGGTGADILMGFGKDDEYRVGPASGSDVVDDLGLGDSFDTLVIDAPRSDVVFGLVGDGTGQDLVLRFLSTGAEIVIREQRFGEDPRIDSFRFSDGTVLSAAEVDTIVNTGTDAGETLLGSSRNDVIDGGRGDDLLRGGAGIDTYLFGADSGADRIQETDFGNRIVLAEGIALEDLVFARGGSTGLDLLVRIVGSEASVAIENGLRHPYVTEFVLGDGTVVGINEVLEILTGGVAGQLTGTDRDDEIYGDITAEVLDGGDGDDRLDGSGGDDIYVFSSGRDQIYDSWLSFDSILAPVGASVGDLRIFRSNGNLEIRFAGFDGSMILHNDFTYDGDPDAEDQYGDVEAILFRNGTSVGIVGERTVGTAGNDVLFDITYSDRTYLPGTGDDLILAGMGDDLFRLEEGFGDVLISDLSGDDTIEFAAAGITQSDLVVTRSGFDIVIRIAGAAGSVTVENQLLPRWLDYGGSGIEMIALADGTSLDRNDLIEMLSTATAGDDWIAAGERDGGAGDDVLVGSDDSDSYVFGIGYGHDVIRDFGYDQEEDYSWGRDIDVVTFKDLSRDDVTFTRASGDPHSILVTIVATGETLLIDRTPFDGHPADPGSHYYMIERFDFADGTSLSSREVRQQVLDADRTGGDDTIVGLGIDTIVDAGPGNDVVAIHSGGAVVLATGGGDDIVYSADSWDSVDLYVRGATPETLRIRPVSEAGGVKGDHLRFELPDGSSVTFLHGAWINNAPQLAAVADAGRLSIVDIIFEDGTRIFYDHELGLLIPGRTTGTAGDDALTGSDEDGNTTNDVFVPGTGDDLIVGRGGTDTIRFGVGDGHDEVIPEWKEGTRYGIEMLPAATLEDLTFRLAEDDPRMLVIGFADAPDTIRIAREALVSIGFIDGRTLLFQDPTESLWVYSGDTVEPGAGNDEITSSSGGVTLVIGRGDGADRFSDWMFDTLIGGDATGRDWTGNTLVLEGAEQTADLIFARDGASEDLVVIFRDTGDRVIIHNQFAGSGDPDDTSRLEAVVTAFVLDDGTLLSWADVQALIEDIDPETIPVLPDPNLLYFDPSLLFVAPTDGSETLYVDGNGTIDSLGGEDRVIAVGASATFLWGAEDGDDHFSAATGTVSVWDGNRVVLDDMNGPQDIGLFRSESGTDLIILNRATGERLTIENQFVTRTSAPEDDGGATVTMFEFGSGLVMTWQELYRLVEGIDFDGDNVIVGDTGGGTLDGGAGSDMLVGGPGDDIYLFDRAYDEDRVRDAGGTDIVQFGPGVGVSDVFFSRTGAAGGDLLIEVMGLDRLALTVEGQFSTAMAKIETFVFAGGDRLSWSDVQQIVLRNESTTMADTINGFASPDFIAGDEGNDVLRGGGGDDHIEGGVGRDTAVYAGLRSDYDIEIALDGTVTVSDLAGVEGLDTLIGVEQLRFLGEGAGAPVLDLTAPNRNPVAATLSLSGIEDQLFSIPLGTLLAQLSDADGDPMHITGISGTTGGSAWIGLDGNVHFRPDADFTGVATISYQIADPNGGWSIGKIQVALAAVNDAPRVGALPAVLEVTEDAPAQAVVTVGAVDPDGDPLHYSIIEGNEAGLFTIDAGGVVRTVRPAGDADVGALQLRIEISDGHGGSASLVVPVVIVGTNDAPETAGDSIAAVEDGAVVTGQLAASDGDGNGGLVFSAAGEAAGFVLEADGSWSFDPSDPAYQDLGAGETRVITLPYSVSDPLGVQVTSAVLITVSGTNDVPAFTAVPAEVIQLFEDSAPAVIAGWGAFDADGDTLVFTIVSGNDGGLFRIDPSGGLTTTRPSTDADVGLHTLQLQVSDAQGGTAIADIVVDVINVNDVPVAQPASAEAVEDHAPVSGALQAVDQDRDATLTFSLLTPVAGLALTGQGDWSFDPADAAYQALAAGQTHLVVADYHVVDEHGAASTSTLSITVTGANDVPTAILAADSSLSTAEDAAPAIVAQIAASDVDGDTLLFSIVDGNRDGLFVVDAQGRISTARSPGDNDVGTHILRVAVADPSGSHSSVDVAVAIANVNDAPVLTAALADQSWTSGAAAIYQVPAGSFRDADGDPLMLSARLSDGNALPNWLTFDPATGTLRGTPPAGAAPLSVRITASDGQASVFDDLAIAVSGGNHGSNGGFNFHSVNSWYDPRWGGGYNVTFRYTVQPDAIVDGHLKMWDIVADYDGAGAVAGGWISGFNGPTNQTLIAGGDGLVFSTVGTGYQPDLKAGDTFYLTLRVDGAAFKASDFGFTIFDRDPAPNIADAGDARLTAASTISWGGMLVQSATIRNISQAPIDDWSVVLDVPDGVELNLASLWGATASRLPNGDIRFEAVDWNDEIAVSDLATFGFVAAYSGAGTLAFDSSSFHFA